MRIVAEVQEFEQGQPRYYRMPQGDRLEDELGGGVGYIGADGSEEGKALGVAERRVTDNVMGIPKTAFWIGIGAIVLIGGYFGYKKFIKK